VDLPDLVVEEDDAEPDQSWDHEVRERKHSGAQHAADPRNVNYQGNQRSFEEQAEVCLVVDHELLTERESPGLGDEEVSLLHIDDRHKEGCLSVF
jgi:hypothetical protein